MSRRDEHFDAMLRHLGAAYYESLHGRASAADVSRALDAIEEHTNEHSRSAGPPHGHAGAARRPHHADVNHVHHGRWHHRVRDVMTTSVVTVDRITPFKDIVVAMAAHQVSAVPVLTMGRHVAGIVSEGDLLTVEDKRERDARIESESGGRLHWRSAARKHWGRTAEELMTSPAVTIHPDATLPSAARLMNSHHLKRLPVVDPDGILLGIVSRCDLLSVFLRTDEDIAREVREMLSQVLLADPSGITVHVKNGVVTLAGQPERPDLVPVAVRLTWDIDGVVDVVDRSVVAAQTG
jgi:CBS domain-containing protein